MLKLDRDAIPQTKAIAYFVNVARLGQATYYEKRRV
jgi:hypothetical protein